MSNMRLNKPTGTDKKPNPLDAVMTKAQVARRKFKSALPRKPENRELTALEAMGRTMLLIDRFRGEMASEELSPDDVEAALIYSWRDGKNLETDVVKLPKPKDIAGFADRVMAVRNPRFLGVLFLQRDHQAEKDEKKSTIFVFPFLTDPQSKKLMIEARNRQMEQRKIH